MTKPQRMSRTQRYSLWIALIAVVTFAIWASDRVTLEGQRTVYSVSCSGGGWQGARCSGTMVAAERYIYRASRRRQEVVHWTLGSASPSVTYRGCTVTDRDNWTCRVEAAGTPPAALQMERGHLRGGPLDPASSVRAVKKWKWWLMHLGLHVFSDAREPVQPVAAQG